MLPKLATTHLFVANSGFSQRSGEPGVTAQKYRGTLKGKSDAPPEDWV